MREIVHHCTDKDPIIIIQALDPARPGHSREPDYRLQWRDRAPHILDPGESLKPSDGPDATELWFRSATAPGITNEALLAVIIDRLQASQVGATYDELQARVLMKIRDALILLKARDP